METQPEALNLLEDGLDLWHEALQQMPTLDPTLLALFPNVVRVCTLSTEHVQVSHPSHPLVAAPHRLS